MCANKVAIELWIREQVVNLIDDRSFTFTITMFSCTFEGWKGEVFAQDEVESHFIICKKTFFSLFYRVKIDFFLNDVLPRAIMQNRAPTTQLTFAPSALVQEHIDDLLEQQVPFLKKVLKKVGLSTSGKKRNLVCRLVNRRLACQGYHPNAALYLDLDE